MQSYKAIAVDDFSITDAMAEFTTPDDITQTVDPNSWVIHYRDPNAYLPEEIAARDTAACAASLAVRRQTNATAQRPACDFNIVTLFGQSEWSGNQCAPFLTHNLLDCVTYGNSVRPTGIYGYGSNMPVFLPVGTADLQPASGHNQVGTNGAVQFIPKQGGFQNVSGISFSGKVATISPDATATMWELVGGVLISTAVGGPGEPALDFTQVFSISDDTNFIDNSAKGAFSSLNFNHFPLTSVTPTTLTALVNFPSSLPNTVASDVDIYEVNNNSAVGQESGLPTGAAWRNLQLKARQMTLASLSDGCLVITNPSVGGTSIEAWQKTYNSPNFYNRYPDVVSKIVASPAAAGKTVCVTAIVTEEGGSDPMTLGATYAALQATVAVDLQTDLSALCPGQTKRPLFGVWQIGGRNSTDFDNNGIEMAMLEFGTVAKPNSDCYTFGPSYFVTDQAQLGGSPHWLPNGEVWAGEQAAKILHRILCEGEGWEPLHWKNATYRGQTILLDFHVPRPPLQFQNVYIGTIATFFYDKGFEVVDSVGIVPIHAVYIPEGPGGVKAQCLVAISVGRLLTGPVRIVLGGTADHNGSTNLCDSDRQVSFATYQYTPFNGQNPSENIPALIGQPFPLWNWACNQNDLALAD